MYHLFLIVGSVFIIIGLIWLRFKYSLVVHPDAELFINLLSAICSEKGKHVP
jgi:hypothetical protein